ncbi:hypothetical protein EMCRGX_G022672 [Ephydatia muelleri]
MWYFRIPDTGEAEDKKGTYTVFNIHVNGSYHCSVRYSVLLEFFLEVKRRHDVSQLDPFPSKKILKMSPLDLEERRVDLERFLASLAQDSRINRNNLLPEFFLAAQHASCGVPMQTVQLEVYLINDKKLPISVSNYNNSDEVLETMCQKLKMAPNLTYYFALFLEKQVPETTEWTTVRYLKSYESPCLSLEKANALCPHRIILRRNFWRADLAHELLKDEIAVSVLYLETSEQINKQEIVVDPEVLKALMALKKKGLKKEYLELAITTPQFGYRQVDSIEGRVRVGSTEMVTYTAEGVELKHMEITKIRCWKVGYDLQGDSSKFYLSVNYHEGNSQFSWVKLQGESALVLTQFLDEAIEELVRHFNKQPVKVPSQQPFQMPRSLTTVLMRAARSPPQSTSTDMTAPTSDPGDSTQPSTQPTATEGADSTTKSAQVPPIEDAGTSKVKVPVQKKKKHGEVENAAFNTLTDDDL